MHSSFQWSFIPALSLAVLGLTLLLPAAGYAQQNLVTNPGFETGDFSGYTLSGDTDEAFVSTPGNSGDESAALTTSFADGFLSQSLATTVGQTYNFSFFLEGDGAAPNSFSASLGGTALVSLTNVPAAPGYPDSSGFQQYIAIYTATGTSTLLSFGFRDDPGYLYLDDISVTAAPAAVPEASSSVSLGLLFSLGLGAMTLARKRNAASRAA